MTVALLTPLGSRADSFVHPIIPHLIRNFEKNAHKPKEGLHSKKHPGTCARRTDVRARIRHCHSACTVSRTCDLIMTTSVMRSRSRRRGSRRWAALIDMFSVGWLKTVSLSWAACNTVYDLQLVGVYGYLIQLLTGHRRALPSVDNVTRYLLLKWQWVRGSSITTRVSTWVALTNKHTAKSCEIWSFQGCLFN